MEPNDKYVRPALIDAIKSYDPNSIMSGIKDITTSNYGTIGKATEEVFSIINGYVRTSNDEEYYWIHEKLCNEDVETLIKIYTICISIRLSNNILNEAVKDAIIYRKHGIFPYTIGNVRSISDGEAIAIYRQIMKGNR